MPIQLHGLKLTRLTAASHAGKMNSSAVLTFVLIGGLVWGGFLMIVATAVRKESRKKKDQG